ncbi:MAG: GDSL-type esterase/lipase family protein [Nannocystaceae bacterium]
MGLTRKTAWLSGIGAVLLLAGARCSQSAEIPAASAAPQDIEEATEPEGPPALASASSLAQQPTPTPTRPPLSADALRARVEAQRRVLGRDSLFEDETGQVVPVREPPPPSPSDPTSNAATPNAEGGLLDALPGSAGMDADGSLEGTARANGNALGLFTPIETRDEQTLAPFYAALRSLADGTRTNVNIAVYGASHTQADIYPGYLRGYLQSRFGAAGRGVVSLVKFSRWYRTTEFSVESSKHWKIEHAQKKERAEEGWFGVMGVSGHSSNKRAWTRIKPLKNKGAASHGSRYEIMFLEQPKGGRFKVYVDGRLHKTVKTRNKTPGLGSFLIETELGPHELEVRPYGDGEVRLFGVVIHNDQPGVVVDTLGISGTRAANHLAWHDEIWRDSFARRDIQLYLLAYGTNETTDVDQPMSVYRRELTQVLERLKATSPDASCVLIGPGDFPEQSPDGLWTTRPRLVEIVEAQRAIAYEVGCGFWDSLAFMGGAGSMHTWATSVPQMAKSDHVHLTRRGYVRMGMAVTDALMAGYEASSQSGESTSPPARPLAPNTVH